MKTKTTALTALMLLAVAALMPACEITRDCDPRVEICQFNGGHPSTLDPEQANIANASAND